MKPPALTYEPKVYFWINGAVVEEGDDSTKWKEGWEGALCIDMQQNDPYARYGVWRVPYGSWIGIPFKEFPEEFKLQLLLLGVSE